VEAQAFQACEAARESEAFRPRILACNATGAGSPSRQAPYIVALEAPRFHGHGPSASGLPVC